MMAYNEQQRHFGENYVQEICDKAPQVRPKETLCAFRGQHVSQLVIGGADARGHQVAFHRRTAEQQGQDACQQCQRPVYG